MKYLFRFMMIVFLSAASLARAEATFSFGVIASGSSWANEDNALREALQRSEKSNLAFIVAQGIKTSAHACTDDVFERRRNLFESSKHGVVVSLAANDWSDCETQGDPSSAVGKLTRVRELFFTNEFSFGATKIPVIRQSTEARFHSFVENARWEIGNVMFATVNLPSDNNHYVLAAGRNGEFEDRLVANREWLRRVFTHAGLRNAEAIVLFSDANPLARQSNAKRDGYVEMRRHLLSMATRFEGKVLIVHAQGGSAMTPTINWRGNIGEIGVSRGWTKIRMDPTHPALFTPSTSAAHQH